MKKENLQLRNALLHSNIVRADPSMQPDKEAQRLREKGARAVSQLNAIAARRAEFAKKQPA